MGKRQRFKGPLPVPDRWAGQLMALAMFIFCVLAPSKASAAEPPSAALPLVIQMRDGHSIDASWVRLEWNDVLRVVDMHGRRTNVPAFKVLTIHDGEGHDITKRVFDQRQAFGTPAAKDSTLAAESRSPLFGHLAQGGYFVRADSYDPSHESPIMVQVDLGAMYQLDDRRSLGWNLFLSGDETFSSLGVKVRGRRLLSDHVVVDLAPGIILATSDELKSRDFASGFVGEGTLTLDRWISITAEADVRPRENVGAKWTDWSWYAGAKIGSRFGIPAVILGLVSIWVIRLDAEDLGY